MRYLGIILILITFLSCKDIDKNGLIVPNWKEGDYRYIKTTTTSFSCINQDTIINVSSGDLYKMTISDKTKKSYFVEIVNLSKPDLGFKTSIDSIDNNSNINRFVGLIKSIPKISIPYKVKITSMGEIVEIVDWKNVSNKFMVRINEIADSIGFNPKEHSYIKQYISSNLSAEEKLRSTLLNEISGNFELYNIPIPKDSVVVKQIQVPNPKTGKTLNTKVEYRTISVKNGIYEIEMKVDFEDNSFVNSQDYVADFFNIKKKKKPLKPKMNNYSIYYWNSETSWIDSSNYLMDLKTDTIEIKMKTKTVLYK